MKKLFKWLKHLFIRYTVTETYTIDMQYATLKCVKDFLQYRQKHLEAIRCKYVVIYLKNLNLGQDVIGTVKTKHYKYNVESNAKLLLKNGLLYFKFV